MVNKDQVLAQVKYYFRASTNDVLRNNQIEIQDDLSVVIDTSVKMVEAPPKGKLPIKLHMVHGTLYAQYMNLKTLENFPDVCDVLFVNHNQLMSLEHSPQMISELYVEKNNLTNFEHLSHTCEYVDAVNNPLTSLVGLPDTPANDLELRITWLPELPLLRLVNVTKIVMKGTVGVVEPLNTILNKYVGKGKHAVLNCALELKQHGYASNARW